MMLAAVILDAHPLSLVCQRRGKQAADACRQWLADCMRAGLRIYVPEVADYEVRRELIRARKTAAVARLDRFSASVPGRYIAITTVAMRRAAELWAESRQAGTPTADPQALDGDVILAGQALTMSVPVSDLVVATSNVRHIARYLPADLWQNIIP
jgi:predicted nucleic acid-binding protein